MSKTGYMFLDLTPPPPPPLETNLDEENDELFLNCRGLIHEITKQDEWSTSTYVRPSLRCKATLLRITE
jgi:hypothetical protein